MWPDNETDRDLLGFQVHADLLLKIVTNPKLLPVTVGLFGDWGGGKTSIMKMLQALLDPDRVASESADRAVLDSTAVVCVNTWLLEGYDDAKSALLSSILIQLGDHKRFGAQVRERAVSLMKSVNWMRLLWNGARNLAAPAIAAYHLGGTPAALAAVGVGTATLALPPKEAVADRKSSDGGERPKEETSTKDEKKSLVEGVFESNGQNPEEMDVRTFRQRFDKMLTDVGIDTLIVLLDDLDRCSPERIVESLEAIKLFVSTPRTAFVIGADPRIVEHAVRLRYAEKAERLARSEEQERLVKDYLEKVIQVPYRLPRLSATEIETYLTLLFIELYLADSDAETCRRAWREGHRQNRYRAFGQADVQKVLGREPPEQLHSALALCSGVAPQIADGLKGNPRQVKRFLNALLIRKELAKVARLDHVRDDVLVKLMILEYTRGDLFDALYNWQAVQQGHPAELATLESLSEEGIAADEESVRNVHSEWSSLSVRRWLAASPRLAKEDLRDYFWIARDRLSTTFSGTAMVPPHLRQLLQSLISGAPKKGVALSSVKQLGSDDLAQFLDLLRKASLHEPESSQPYKTMIDLASEGVPGATESLCNHLLGCDLTKVPPGIGAILHTALTQKPALREVLRPALEKLQSSQTRVGRAFQTADSRKSTP